MAETRRPRRRPEYMGFFPSLTMDRMIGFRSSLIEDYLYLLDWSPDVVSIEDLNISIRYSDGRRFQSCHPDIRVVLATTQQPVVIMGHQVSDLTDDQAARRAEAVYEWCLEHSCTCRLITAADVQVGYRLTNIKMLRRFADYTVSPALTATIQSSLLLGGHSYTVAQLADTINVPYPTAMSAIFALAYQHQLLLPIDTELLCGDSRVLIAPPG